jgi:alanine transaminase
MDLLVDPPTVANTSEAVFAKYNAEVTAIKNNLRDKAEMLTHRLNKIPNFKCNKIEGAMYAFPRILFPQKAIDLAKANNMNPDLFFALELLQHTGIISVPGSGFGQQEGTHHIRITNLIHDKKELEKVLDLLEDFAVKFFNKL